MGIVIDTSLWIDHFRPSTPRAVKDQVLMYLNQKDVFIAEPILFELLSNCPRRERSRLESYFALVPLLPTPPRLWREAAQLGQQCKDAGLNVPAMDILIASLCIHHGVELATFDSHFSDIGQIAPLKAVCLARAA